MKFMSSFQCLMGGDSATQSSDVENEKRRNITSKKKKKDADVIKVLKADGEMNVYHKPIRASEVMTEHHMVCRSDSFYIGHKIPPLAHHDHLQPGHTYFLLPAHLFHSVLSFLTIASFSSSSSSSSSADMNMQKAAFLKKAAASSYPPFDIQKTPSGTLRIRVSELFISHIIMMDQHDHHMLCTTPQLHRDYKQLVVGSRKTWKPKLQMIKETSPPTSNSSSSLPPSTQN